MWETIAIIASLGGLELTLWLLSRRAQKADREMQRKQLEILDGILTELAIQNSQDTAANEWESEARHEASHASANCSQEHPVRH